MRSRFQTVVMHFIHLVSLYYYNYVLYLLGLKLHQLLTSFFLSFLLLLFLFCFGFLGRIFLISFALAKSKHEGLNIFSLIL